MQRLVDPFPGNRRKLPSRQEYKKILAARDPADTADTAVKQARLSTLCNGLLHGSIALMPRELRRRFKGNTALDATKIPLNGWLGGPSRKNPNGAHCSINYDGGWYVREGNHDGSGTTYKDTREWATEAEITTMTADTLQATLAEIGAKPVFDYDKDEQGQTTFYEDLIQVGGQWYVNYMPQDLIHALDL